MLTKAKAKALEALLKCPTKTAAADMAGIGVSTLRRYLNDEEFLRYYKEALDALVEDATNQAKKTLSPALETLMEIAKDKEEAAPARVSASRSLIEYTLKLIEMNDILKLFRGDTDVL